MKNRKVRRALAGLLGLGMAASMVFGTAGAVMADDDPEYYITKVFEAEHAYTTSDAYGNPSYSIFFCDKDSDDASSAKLFSVSDSAYQDVDSVPAAVQWIKIDSLTYDIGEAGSQTKEKKAGVHVPEASAFGKPGRYTYKFKEEPLDTYAAGVIYDTSQYYLTVTVGYGSANTLEVLSVIFRKGDPENGEKVTSITNTYQSGQLTIAKKVSGKMGDRSATYKVDVTLTAPAGKAVRSFIEVSTTNEDAETAVSGIEPWGRNVTSITKTYELKDGTSVTLTNIPAGVTYSVREQDASKEGYTVSYTKGVEETYAEGTAQTVTASTDDTITVVNAKDGTEDTGISAGNLRYILVLAVIGCGVAVCVIAKSRRDRA